MVNKISRSLEHWQAASYIPFLKHSQATHNGIRKSLVE